MNRNLYDCLADYQKAYEVKKLIFQDNYIVVTTIRDAFFYVNKLERKNRIILEPEYSDFSPGMVAGLDIGIPFLISFLTQVYTDEFILPMIVHGYLPEQLFCLYNESLDGNHEMDRYLCVDEILKEFSANKQRIVGGLKGFRSCYHCLSTWDEDEFPTYNTLCLSCENESLSNTKF